MLPVAGGIVFFALLALATWGIAALLSKNPDRVSTRLATPTFEVGRTETIAELIADQGPLLFQGLVGSEGDRSVVLDHTGDTVKEGQQLFIIEAMKTMNPVPSPRAGTVTAILVHDAQPVEYGEALCVIE